MEIVKLTTQIIAIVAGGIIALSSILLFLKLRWPAAVLWILKLYTSSLSSIFAILGAVIAITGLATDSVLISLIGTYDVVIFTIHIYRVTRPPDFSTGFEMAFGLHWEERISEDQKIHFLSNRGMIRLPDVPNPRLKQNIIFATIPDTSRQLLCDIWEPPEYISPSGLAFIYIHGSAWYLLDKDLGTRPFFSHLTSQGHVVMDVAHRLAPETDMMGMVNDIKRAIAWMKDNAQTYRVDPKCIVVGGGSAGGHLAMLTAYTENNTEFTPTELEEKNFSVRAVISIYGPSDLEAMYYHTNQHLTTKTVPGRQKKAVPTQMPAWLKNKMGKDFHRLGFDKGFVNAGAFAPLLGGHPDQCPETYAYFSPVTHVHDNCPSTLLIHGEHDVMAPVKSTRFLYNRLLKKKVLTVMHILPQTDHAFDLQLPKISPAAHNALYDIERFLALHAKAVQISKRKTREKEEYELNY